MQEEHPFAPYIRILGKGKKGSRGFTAEEAHDSMSMILRDEITEAQLGAFLMLLRVKEETPEEVAGFVKAIRDFIDYPEEHQADLDWSSYAGKRRHSPWYVLSALLLAENGIKVCMHGAEGHTPGRIYTSEVLKPLGIKTCATLDEAREEINKNNFSYMPLQTISTRLKDIIELRPFLGLRSPIHTVGRMINPLKAPYSIQAIFHPGYQKVHQEAAQILGEPHLAVFKGEAGEVERNPDTECTVSSVHHSKMSDEIWPPLFAKRHVKEESLDVNRLPGVWRGNDVDEYAEAAITATTAIALQLMGKADSQQNALREAQEMWSNRNKSKY
ncbi:MAG: glycosyl transferase family protein [Gammaproteobacteria bacterium]|nr:glycosyl transferase family protein [Gammaproteobacteria bacterium]MCW8911572.1 glycosyl transferase family protein [Gammaproteobacteria bacterium]MCW9005825.1 glycosyl transferase family protein [Gammaproteobacteria bacterium]MCW9056438.1 glycosyl transferase family protein [Gammaproteobacteria bacterium]